MKATFCTLLVMFISSAALAQEETPSDGVSIGINGGATYSSIRGNDLAEANDPAFNFLIGVSAEIPLSDKLSFMTAINYERKSVKQTLHFDYLGAIPPGGDPAFIQGDVETNLTLEYITVPLNIRYYFGSKKIVYINGGPFIGFFGSEYLKIDGEKADEDNNDFYKSIDLGVNLGIGAKFRLSDTQAISIEVRDNLGLTNISNVPIVGNGTLKTNAFNLIANWQFTL